YHGGSDLPAAGRFLASFEQTEPGSAMARGDVRIGVTLACEECKRRNYQTNKSKRNDPERITLRKYCKWCRRHTGHRETRYRPDDGTPPPAPARSQVRAASAAAAPPRERPRRPGTRP